MRYPPSLLDEIRARLPVSAVVGRKVRLKKAGREWKGLSPFNAEKTPSFYVNDQKGFYHCFSSGKHGDIFTFLMETEGLTFPEAVERLAAETGVALPKVSREAEEREERRRTLHDVVELACRFFEAQLQTSKGQGARDYLLARRIAPETQAEFRIGFAPDGRTALTEHLRARGVADDEIVRAGLAIVPDDGRGMYDRFRGRVIIPIQDLKGRVVAFGGRALSPDAQPKYLNSPETELFSKGRLVFNGHRARPAAFKAGSAVVVEGYLDAIAVYQGGLKAVVATLGTAFTEEQIAELWRFAPEPVICLDGDRAGREAAFRAIDRILPALQAGHDFKFAFLPNGNDPDDLIKAAGIDAFRKVVDEAQSFWDVLWAREVGAANLSSENGQAVFEKRIRELIRLIPDETLRRRYELVAKIQVGDFLWRLTRRRVHERLDGTATRPFVAPELLSAEPTRLVGLERIFLGMCVHYPDLFQRKSERIVRLHLRGSHDGRSFNEFATELERVVSEYEVDNCRDFYNLMDDGYYGTLDFVHGRQISNEQGQVVLPWGHNLFARFPILQFPLSETFVERCFDNFFELLLLRDLEDERADLLRHIPQEITEDYEHHLIGLQRAIQEVGERTLHEELELAEEAGQYRSAGGTRYRIAPNPRGAPKPGHALLAQEPRTAHLALA
ncbi:MAG TPA: DNA primase [Beijerinckiaceae bacterium]